MDALEERGVLLLDVELNLSRGEDAPCRLAGEEEEGSVTLSLLCRHDQWMLEGGRQRALELARMIYEEEQDVLKVGLRTEILSYNDPEEPQATVCLPHGTHDAQGKVLKKNHALIEKLGDFFQLCQRLCVYARASIDPDDLLAAVPEAKGILIEAKDGKLSHRLAEGKDRPALMCSPLFGAPRKMRPYRDDALRQFMNDDMDLEEKIQEAEDGDVGLMNELGMVYLNGDDEVEPDAEKAFYWFTKLAEAGESGGMFNTGLFCAKGFGTPRDFAKAAEWMEKAAEAGDGDAEGPAEEYRKLADSLAAAEAGDGPGPGGTEPEGTDIQIHGGCRSAFKRRLSPGGRRYGRRGHRRRADGRNEETGDGARPGSGHRDAAHGSHYGVPGRGRIRKRTVRRRLPPRRALSGQRSKGQENHPGGISPVAAKGSGGGRPGRAYLHTLGWAIPDPAEKQAQKKEETPVADSGKNRASIGGFFTLEVFTGLVMANEEKEEYEEKDTMTTLFDTTGGKEMEMGFFGGIQNGLFVKLALKRELSNEDQNLALYHSRASFAAG